MRAKSLQTFQFILILLIVLSLNIFLHEMAHGITAELLGGEFTDVYIWPGIQVWPEFEKSFDGNWQSYIARMHYNYGKDWQPNGWQSGLVSLMGSGFTLIVALIALIALGALHSKGFVKMVLLAESLMYFDLVFYTFLPLVGLRHLFFIGGNTPEPLIGAEELGVPAIYFLIMVAVIFIGFTWAIMRLLRSAPEKSHKEKVNETFQ